MAKKITFLVIITSLLVACGGKKSSEAQSEDYELSNESYLEYINDKDTTKTPFAHYPLGFVWQADTIDEWYGSYFENEAVSRLQFRTIFLRDSVNEAGALEIVFDKHKDADRPYVFAVELSNNVVSEYVGIAFFDENSNLVMLDAENNYNAISIPLDKEATLHNEENANMRFGELLYFNSYIANQAIIVLDNANGKKVDVFALCKSSAEMQIHFKYSDNEEYIVSIPLNSFKKQYQLLK